MIPRFGNCIIYRTMKLLLYDPHDHEHKELTCSTDEFRGILTADTRTQDFLGEQYIDGSTLNLDAFDELQERALAEQRLGYHAQANDIYHVRIFCP